MKRQSGYGGFPTILLTFSLLLLVLAIGFVVGRVVVARLYVNMAPKFEQQSGPEPSVPEPVEVAAKPGRVYVPPPAPPERPPEGLLEGERPPEEGVGPAGEQPEVPLSSGGGPEQSRPEGKRPEGAGSEAGGRPLVPTQRPAEPSTPQVRGTAPREEPKEAGSYSVQVGVFSSRQGARRMVDELARSGYPARIEVARKGTQTLYRVLTGSYQTEYAARQAVDQLRREGFDAFMVEQ